MHKKLNTLSPQFTSKNILIKDDPELMSSLRKYFLNSYSVYERLFELLNDNKAYYIRAQPLRHPLIFYYGHTASVYVNKLIDFGIIEERINDKFQKVFAVGVDEMDWDDLNEEHYDWPTVEETRVFRQQVKEMVLKVIDASHQEKIQSWMSKMWVLLMAIQHERIHIETSAVIIRRVSLHFINQVQQFVECEYRETDPSKIPLNSLAEVSPWRSVWNRTLSDAKTYGWDNEFGRKELNVEAFQASSMLVSNGEFLEFVLDNGYQNPEWWSKEGNRWIESIKPAMPLFWQKDGDQYRLRTLSKLIDMPWDWPVQVNNLQARAFCRWKSSKMDKYLRLPTEDEYYSIRSILEQDQPTWEYQSVGNINLEYWMSPNPVNLFKTGQFYDIVGNVWQHTITPTYPFQGFQFHPVYEDFSTPTFDDRHDLIKGGSFISTGNESLYHSRYAFRRHFHQFAGFRYIHTSRQLEIDLHCGESISDKNVEMSLKHHYLDPNSYVVQLAEMIKAKMGSKVADTKVLTVGCSVGRIPLQLGRFCSRSIGIDETTRYFQMITRLRQKGCIKAKDMDISLKRLSIDAQKVEFYQMNALNPDQRKISGCGWIVIDGLSIKKHTLSSILRKIVKLADKNATIAILNVTDYNTLSKEEGKIILEEVAGSVSEGDECVLNASSSDQGYLPEWHAQLQFRLCCYNISAQ